MRQGGFLRVLVCVSGSALAITCGCGGGGVGSPTHPPPPQSFSISAAPAQLTILPNSTALVNLALSASNGLAGTVNVELSGQPSGITTVPASPFTLPASGVTVTLAAGPAVSVGTYSLSFTASSGSLVSSAPITLTVSATPTASSGSRTDFVATDDTPSSIVYDSAHNAIYADLPDLGRVDVIDAATHQVLGVIPAPGSTGNSGLSLTPDGKRILVSGVPQQVSWIDTGSRKLSQLQTLPLFQNSCCPLSPAEPGKPMVMSSGRVLFLGYSPLSNGIMEWDPSAGTLIARNPDPKFSVFFPQGTIGARSADGTKAIFSDDALPSSLAIFDAATDSFAGVSQVGNFAFALAANPTGTQFAVAVNLSLISIVDSHLNTIGQVAVGGTITGMTYSPDGKKLYIVSTPGNVPLISTVDTSTFQVLGQAPAYASDLAFAASTGGPFVEKPQAADGTGLLFGLGDHGVAFDDSTYFQNIPSTATTSVAAVTVDPAQGPQRSSTSVSITIPLATSPPLVWFGALLGLNPSLNSSGLVQVQVGAPPAPSVGSVNVKLLSSDGTEGNIPNGFTYGVVPITSPVLAVAPSGGLSADIFGYGFGSDVGAPPQVQIGSAAASIQKNVLFPSEYVFYPFPLDHVRVAVPAGSPGASDITIASPAGTAKIGQGIHYVQSVNDYPSSDQFTCILYDAQRSQLYLSATDHIDIFSLSSNTFITPIVPPTLAGSFRILGLALTPDGSKLLAANYSDNSLAIINPDNPSSAHVVRIIPPGSTGPPTGPTQLAATSSNHALVVTSDITHSFTGGGGALYDVDLSAFSVKVAGGPFNVSVSEDFLAASRDGSKIVLGIPGNGVFVFDSPANTWFAGPPRSPFEVAASGDGNVFASDGLGSPPSAPASLSFFDANANLLAVSGLPPYLGAIPATEGIRLNDAGSLAYEGVSFSILNNDLTYAPDFVDIYDVQHHELSERVVLTEKFPPQETVQNGLAIDPTGKDIFIITASGLTIVTLDSVPLSIGSITPNSAASGTAITIRGSGFTSKTTATCNGIAVDATFGDADTLQLVLPQSLATGPVSITLTNPDGSTYKLDAAFQVK